MKQSGRLYHRNTVSQPVMFSLQTDPHLYTTRTVSLYDSLPIEDYIPRIYGANLMNTSTDGLYLESDIELPVGTKIHISMTNFIPLPLGSQDATHCTAMVKWCNKKKGCIANCFETGLKRIRDTSLPTLNLKTTTFASLKCF